MTPQEFIKKWAANERTERAASQSHFNDLCDLLGHPKPLDVDPTGDEFTFEKGATTVTGGDGFADVWKRHCFAWEYKGKHKDLVSAYAQLKRYADALDNPPLLIVSDMRTIVIHTAFTNAIKKSITITLDDLADPAKRADLKAAFVDPEKLHPRLLRQTVTQEAAEQFSELAHHLQAKGYDPQRVAHFLNRLIFCMFAEDVGLLPNRIFTKLATASVAHPEAFEANARQLFGGMAKGGAVAFEVIDWFNGGLFDDDATLPLDKKEIELVLKCAALDWSNIEPSIFGTLFERGLDPDKRSQQGTHYTDPETIKKIVRPVVLEPWQRDWEIERAEIARLIDRAKKTVSEAAKQQYFAFLERLANFRVLDPACGSGNFLYLSLRALKDFEKRVIHEAQALGLPLQFPRVGPEAVLGIEVNPYAAELARVTIWIGELQWMLENGFSAAKNPILKPLDQIERRDALINDDGTESAWPKVHAIVGNPPFLGDKKMIRELGEEYVARLRSCYKERVPGGADLVCYWFQKAGAEIQSGNVRRAGLVATNSIRSGKSQRVLAQIVAHAPIFEAWSDEDWVNEGADVRVSLICFGESSGSASLDGAAVNLIHADLTATTSTSGVDLTGASRLQENAGSSFQGVTKSGPFDISGALARKWLALPSNPNGLPNSDVLRPMISGGEITQRSSDRWVIDFAKRSLQDGCLYQTPFEYAELHVKPFRQKSRQRSNREQWWQFERPRPEMWARLKPLQRYIATPKVSKHRVFVWLPTTMMPDNLVVVISRDDDVTMGVLQSCAHQVWSLRKAAYIGVGNDPTYTPTSTFETFPFPDGLAPNISATQVVASAGAQRIAAAAVRLLKLRDNWLNPPELVDRVPEIVAGYPDRLLPKSETAAKELKARTLTSLYNSKPTWLQQAHAELDAAVAAAYGWEWPLTEDEIIARLFRLNQERSARQGETRH